MSIISIASVFSWLSSRCKVRLLKQQTTNGGVIFEAGEILRICEIRVVDSNNKYMTLLLESESEPGKHIGVFALDIDTFEPVFE